MHYESEIWSCADLLISSGIKQSKFPDYMMPFFALVMLEGRMLNEIPPSKRKKASAATTKKRSKSLLKPSAIRNAATTIT